MAKLYVLPTSNGVVTMTVNYAGVGQMLRYHQFWPPLESVAEKIASIARANAPVARHGNHKGRYKGSFEVVRGERVDPHPRVFARVQNTAPEALAVEYGTRATRRKGPPHRTLRNAAASVKGI